MRAVQLAGDDVRELLTEELLERFSVPALPLGLRRVGCKCVKGRSWCVLRGRGSGLRDHVRELLAEELLERFAVPALPWGLA